MEIDYDRLEKDVKIEYSSLYELELLLRDHAVAEQHWSKLYGQAICAVDNATLNLEIVVAEVMDEKLRHLDKISATAKQEMRRTEVPLDIRYRTAKRALIDATETMNILKGASYSMTSRRFLLIELAKSGYRTMGDTVRVHGRSLSDDQVVKATGMLEDI